MAGLGYIIGELTKPKKEDIEDLAEDKDKQLELEMSKKPPPPKQSSDSHDNNYGLFNINSDSKTWSNKEQEANSWSWSSWSWTDLLEVFILVILLGFLYGYLKKKYEQNKERKLTGANRKLLMEMKERDQQHQIIMPTAQAFMPTNNGNQMVQAKA